MQLLKQTPVLGATVFSVTNTLESGLVIRMVISEQKLYWLQSQAA